MDFFEGLFREADIWAAAATKLAELPPSVRNPKAQSQVVDALNRIIYPLDLALEYPEIDDAILPLIACFLVKQIRILLSRFVLLQNHDDIIRAIHLSEVVPQFLDREACSLYGYFGLLASELVDNLKSLSDYTFFPINTWKSKQAEVYSFQPLVSMVSQGYFHPTGAFLVMSYNCRYRGNAPSRYSSTTTVLYP